MTRETFNNTSHETTSALSRRTFMTRSLRSAISYVTVLALLLGSLAVMPQTAHAQGHRVYLRVENMSSYTIYRLYMSSTERGMWGPDQLRTGVIRPGESFTLTGISPDEYDIKVVDEDGDSCVIGNVSVFRDSVWTLRNQNLLRCEARTY